MLCGRACIDVLPLAMLSYGLLMTIAVGSGARSLTTRAGVTTGAVVSFLLWFTADFMLYGISNVGNRHRPVARNGSRRNCGRRHRRRTPDDPIALLTRESRD